MLDINADREKSSAEKAERGEWQEVVLRGGVFRFCARTKKSIYTGLEKAEFVNEKGESRDVFDLFGGTIPVEVSSFYKDAYVHADPENEKAEKITLSQLKTEKGVRTFLHEGGHFKQFHTGGTERVALLRKEFSQSLRAYRPLEDLFELADRFVTLVPSLKGELAVIKARYEQADKREFHPPEIDPEALRKQADLKQGEKKIALMRKEAELCARQLANACLDVFKRKLDQENLAVIKIAEPLMSKVAAGTLPSFMDQEAMCGAQFFLDPVRIDLEYINAMGEIERRSFRFPDEDEPAFRRALEEKRSREEQIEVLDRSLSDLRHFLSKNSRSVGDFIQTHRYFEIAGTGTPDVDFDRRFGTLTYFMEYATILLERDATERAIEWMTQLRDEMGIDLLAEEGDDWHLTLYCLGTYGANSSQLLERIGFIPRIEESPTQSV